MVCRFRLHANVPLSVDDHKIVRDGIKALLFTNGEINIVGECEDGNQVLDFLENNKVDLILMDINMTNVNGIECTKSVNEKYPEIKIIALTMHIEEGYISKILKSGASGYILKNTGKAELIDAIKKVFNGENYVSRAFNNIARLAHPDFEWIIVYDGSEDGSRSLIQDHIELHGSLRVRFITAGRIGRQAALNRAVEAADCEYICNQDIDDLSEPDRLSLQSDFLSQNKDVGVLGGAYYVVDTIRNCRFAR